MKQLYIADSTVSAKAREGAALGFKEKIEIIRHLEKLGVSVIHLPKIADERADTLLVRTMCAFAKQSTLAIEAGDTKESATRAWEAVSGAAHPRLVVSLPLSVAQMEYTYHKKAPKMLEMIRELVSHAVSLCPEVEFCALDATRAEDAFLREALATAAEAGAGVITVCDSASMYLPVQMGGFVSALMADVPALADLRVGVWCSDAHHMGLASAISAIGAGAEEIRVAVGAAEEVSLGHIAQLLKDRREELAMESTLSMTEVFRTIRQIEWITSPDKTKSSVFAQNPVGETAKEAPELSKGDSLATVISAIATLGYDLSEEDNAKVYEAFCETAEKKSSVSYKELDAIIAGVALQVPPTYRVETFVINSGNVIGATAQITLSRDGTSVQGFAMGDGPIDAAFRAIEQVVGTHYELDDFRISSVTEGKEAMGSALIRLRTKEKLYAGNGISTDIIDASIRAYVSALNKIAYEEANA